MNEARRYLHPILDSARWARYQPRDDDVIVATSFKSGTTWMQLILLHLLYGVKDVPLLRDMDHWVDFRALEEGKMLERLEGQRSRRIIKTHLPFDAIPYHREVKYIVVDRDPRDVGMSLWNHYRNMNLGYVNDNLPSGVKPIPPCPGDIHTFFRRWLTVGYFDWEQEGFPFWSNLRHVQTWFDVRGHDNVLHVHYGDLLRRPESEISRVAGFIGAGADADQVKQVSEVTSFNHVKSNLDALFPGGYGLFRGGADTFFNKGVNGRWKGVLTRDDLDLFETVSRKILSRECREWLARGSM
ncbi:sulfotransferase domain-containing protein [Microbulbifer yueqingensis]|uniref:Aryl sulfotransferase n=1 Tax=Microbulbifer yueqingensis TaxID=658219 RepID=A0A1G9DXD8_9GAMM|nr:sulfotransferase domain-containing protein [Microbulbifer yueqingensis]SDK68534.1 aryl sulfotransferase [Microbulbifer yueqingensis]